MKQTSFLWVYLAASRLPVGPPQVSQDDHGPVEEPARGPGEGNKPQGAGVPPAVSPLGVHVLRPGLECGGCPVSGSCRD